MHRPPRLALAWFLPLLGSAACTIEPPVDTIAKPLENSCEQDSDCVVGFCSVDVGRCSRRDTDFKALLLEVVPPMSDQTFGGRSYYHRVLVGSPEQDLELVLEPREVVGQVSLWLDTCFGHSILLSLRRRSEALGLRPVRLAIESATLPVEREFRHLDYTTRLNRFTMSAVPPGAYDVYFRNTGYEPRTVDCPDPAVPQLHRGLLVGGEESRVHYEFDQTAPPPVELLVTVPFRPELHGWIVDVVHNVTGERLSTEATLDQANAVVDGDSTTVTVSIRHALVSGRDYRIGPVFQGGTYVRLRPPESTVYPAVYFGSLLPVEPVSSAEVNVPQIGPFSELVPYRAWVWGEGEPHLPIRGRVILSAFGSDRLSDVRAAQVSYSRTLEIAEDGSFEAELLPGRYDADIVPDRGTGYGRFRTTLTVWGSTVSNWDAGAGQAARVLAVPRAPRLTGRARGPGNTAPVGARVVAGASARGGFTPPTLPLRFLPRPNDVLASDTGRFEAELDCSSCSEQTPIPFDIVVQPTEHSGLPWLVFHDLPVAGNVDLGRISLQVPRLLRGFLWFRTPTGRLDVYAGPLIRAYAMIDRDGNLVEDPTLPDCIDLDPPLEGEESLPCVQRVVQIGEATTNRVGRFELPLPASFGRLK